ncbi:hypothetical protein B0H14DRAFT_3701264 [Mycena olivaceomarginata]|nr:hypothetical protein B0H14DRAFT_3701264 [Mycena olivaceomarginata]
MNEADLDLHNPANWPYWNAAVHATTMCTLMLERLAREKPASEHRALGPWACGNAGPGPSGTSTGLTPPNQRSQDEGREAWGVPRYQRPVMPSRVMVGSSWCPRAWRREQVWGGGGGGAFQLMQTERVLITRVCWLGLGNGAWMKIVWSHTEEVWAAARARSPKDEL